MTRTSLTVSASSLRVSELAHTWAVAACRTTYLPMSGEEIEQLLVGFIDRLVTAVSAPQIDEKAALAVGAELVKHHLTGPRSIGCSIEILGDGLPRLAVLHTVPGLDAAVRTVLGALADGYAGALRQHILNEQEMVNQALRKAMRDAERGMRVSEGRFREIFSASAVGIAISSLDGVLVEANKAFADLVGRSRAKLVGGSLLELLDAENNLDLSDAYRKLTTGELLRFRYQHELTDGSGDIARTYLAGSPLRDADGEPTHHITTVEDVTELYLLQQELSVQALHDTLTGLPNEHYFLSHLQEVLERTDPAALVTVCRINLDSFSVISHGVGRTTGERLLCAIASRLQFLVKDERAMVARTGTDDFAILIEDGPHTPDLNSFASSINEELSEPIYFGERGFAVSAGVGVVRRPAGGISPAELLRAADATLHRVKRSGRGQWGLYDMQADAEERARYRLAAEMPGAFECGEISLEYQPVHCLSSGRVIAVQALLRWDRSDGTVVPHSDCLALAEKTGLVLSLGRWMLQAACAELGRCRELLGDVALRVDLTARLSQDPDLVAVVHEALAGTGLQALQLWVGVPLEALARNRGDVVDNVHVLADLGAGVVLLGAGAGTGCAVYLEDTAATALEMAPQTVARIARRPGADSVAARGVRAAIPLVHSVNATMIIPDVDTAAQADWWRAAGADAARGAYFGSPISADQLRGLLTGQ